MGGPWPTWPTLPSRSWVTCTCTNVYTQRDTNACMDGCTHKGWLRGFLNTVLRYLGLPTAFYLFRGEAVWDEPAQYINMLAPEMTRRSGPGLDGRSRSSLPCTLGWLLGFLHTVLRCLGVPAAFFLFRGEDEPAQTLACGLRKWPGGRDFGDANFSTLWFRWELIF